MQVYTHFRSVFDVTPTTPLSNPWAALVGEVRAWISRKEGDDLKGFFFTGGTWNGSSKARVETRLLATDGASPEVWAVRYEHPDASVKFRRWVSNISVTEVGPRDWRLSVVLTHGLKAGYIGPEPQAPLPTSPRLITGLLSSRNWRGRVGDIELRASPQTLKVGKGLQFAALLQDPKRLIPVVLVSCDRKDGKPKLDSVELSRALAGTAVVYVCEGPESDQELEYLIPYRFRSSNGTVRIYAPGLTFEQEWTAGRHRFFTGSDIESVGDDEIIGQIARALTRSDAWRSVQASVTSIDDIVAIVRERRVAELRNSESVSQSQKDELIGLYEDDNKVLNETVKRLKSELDAAQGRAFALEDTLEKKEYEVGQARSAAAEAREDAKAERRALQAVTQLIEWPREPYEVARLALEFCAERVVFTDEALRSLHKSDFSTCDDAASITWRCIRAMATVLLELIEQGIPAQQIADQFKTSTKFELTWTESKETKRDNRLMAQRQRTHNGRKIDITPHVKWGDTSPRLLRAHFYVDREKGQIVVGHFGDHLDTFGTRRRG